MADARIVLSAADRTQGAFATVGSNLAALGARAQVLSEKFAAVTGAFAAVSAAGGLTVFFRGVVDGLDRLNDLRDATGASIENISALEDVAARTGTSFDTVGSALVKLNQQLQNAKPGDDTSRTLQAIGLSAAELRKLDPAEALLRVSQGLANFADDGNKARAVQELFGKSVREVAPLLNDLAEKGRLNGTVTAEQVRQAEKFNQQLAQLAKNATDAGRSLVSDLLPALNKGLELLRGLQSGPGLGAALGEVFKGNTFRTASEALDFYNGKLKELDVQIVRLQKLAQDPRLSIQLSSQREIERLGRQRQEVQKFADAYAKLAKQERRPANEGGGRLAGAAAADTSISVPGAQQAVSQYEQLINRLRETLRGTQDLTEAERVRIDIAENKLGSITAKQREYALELAGVIDLQRQAAEVEAQESRLVQQQAEEALNVRRRQSEELQAIVNASAGARFDELVRQTEALVASFNAGETTAQDYARGIEVLGQRFEELASKTEKAADQTNEFAAQAARNIQDALGDTLLRTMEGNFKSIGDLWKDLIKRLVAQAAAAQLSKALFGENFGKTGEVGGAASTFFTWLGSLQARAGGGPVTAGQPYLVGEKGPEVMVPKQAGMVLPNGVMPGGGAVTVNLYGDTSERQIARIARVARQVQDERNADMARSY